jgi:ABC-type lipoprotein export system ATPase subunit
VSAGDVVVALRGVSRIWRLDAVDVPALTSVDLELRRGEATALTGPSGSGKSTLLHLAALLDTPSTGTVLLEGREVSSLSDDERSTLRLRRIGFVHQTYPLVAALTPRQNVALPAVWSGRPRRDAEQRAGELLARVGLSAEADRDVRTLSGGQRQRVAIARALINDPVVVYADEPTAALDAESGERVLDVLFAAVRGARAALAVATHDAAVAARADRVVRIVGGRIA